MKDPGQISELIALMEDKKIYIADGHHRLSVAFKLGLPYVAMYLSDMYSEGIVILPYHRIARSNFGRNTRAPAREVKGLLRVEKVAFTGPRKAQGLLSGAWLQAQNPSFGLFCQRR